MQNNLKINDLILLTIKKIGINGEGIGYYKKQAIFVNGALPQEVVEVKISEIYNNYSVGIITKLKEKSSQRIEPKCPYFSKCGGCQLQHLSYEGQLYQKKLLVKEAFERYFDGNSDRILIHDVIGMEEPWHYRNKSSLPCRHDGEKIVCGIYAQNTNHLVFINECIVEEKIISKIRNDILIFLSRENIDIYNPKTHQGSLRYLIIRVFSQEDVQVTFILTKEDTKIIRLIKKLPFKSINYSVNNDHKSIEFFGNTIENVKGSKYIDGKLNNLHFQISPNAFFQLNTLQTIALYDEIKKICKLQGNENIIDCHCGIGSIGLYLADAVKEIRGIDINKDSIIDASNFARLNNIKNAFFYSGEILPHLQQFRDSGFEPDIIILDPPRKGLDLNIINYLKKAPVKRIIYVSCNPATLAKNLNHLQSHYHIRLVQPLDMFPQTANVECIVFLGKK